MDPQLIPIAVTVAVATVILGAIALFLRRKGQRLTEQLGPAFELGTTRQLGPFASGLEGQYRGFSCRYLVQLASQYDRGGATLRVDAASAFAWSVERGQGSTKLLVSIGVLEDVEVGDIELDERYRFATDDQPSLLALMGTDTVRTALRDLGQTDNFESLRVRPERTEIKWSPRDPALDENPEELRRRLDTVAALLTAAGSTPRLRAPM
jgi:hypothetical protein